MLKHLSRFILLTLISLCAVNAWGATVPSYQVELIVFSHINSAALKSEYWPVAPPLTIPENTLNLANEQILSEKQWQLKPLHKLLLQNQYPVLLHLAWRQSNSSLQQGVRIHLVGGDVYGDQVSQLNGTLYIHLERYFNLHFDLQFLLPWSNIQNLHLENITHASDDDYMEFNINEKLRMRSSELNYIDHPLYGILIEIFPTTST